MTLSRMADPGECGFDRGLLLDLEVVVFAFIASTVTLGGSLPSGKALLALIPLIALLAGLIVYCLTDLIRARSVRYLPKFAWALIIVLVSAPIGALAYLVFGKDRHGHDLAEAVGGKRRAAGPAGDRLAAPH